MCCLKLALITNCDKTTSWRDSSTRISLSDSRWSESTINTHKYNIIYWSSSRSYYNLALQKWFLSTFRTDSISEFSMNFKRGSNLLEKYDKSSKILSWLDLHKSEFSWAHLYARKLSFTQVPKGLGLNKRKEFEFEIQTLKYL
jgi:hypothetical protein